MTPLLLGISPKMPFEASRAVFWSLSDYKEQKLPKMLFISRELCGLLFQMQNISPGPCVIPWAFHEHFSFFEDIYSLRGVES